MENNGVIIVEMLLLLFSNWILDQIHIKQNYQHWHLKSPTS